MFALLRREESPSGKMGAGTGGGEDLGAIINCVDQKPIGLNVALTESGVITCQRVVIVLWVERFFLDERLKHIVQKVHWKPPFDCAFSVFPVLRSSLKIKHLGFKSP